MKLSTLFPLIDGGAQPVQPHHVRDVAEAVTEVLAREETKGNTYYLAGPEVLT